MSTKSYTLADGTTATVNATDNGVPFNDGMNVLSKAIKAKIDTSSGGATNKQQPTLSLGEWAGSNNTYSAVVSYNGDGVLTANTGTLSGSTITVSDEDGNFSGVISAAEGTNFAPAQLAFNHSKETVGGAQKLEPTLSLPRSWNYDDNHKQYWTYTYNGDGQILAWGGDGTSDQIMSLADVYKGTALKVDTVNHRIYFTADSSYVAWEIFVYATEGEKYAAKEAHFYDME